MCRPQPYKFARALAGNESQTQTRKAQGFPQCESSLAAVWPTQRAARTSTTRCFGADGTTTTGACSWLQRILSYLGTRNPLPLAISSSDVVWLFDNTAYLDDNSSGTRAAGQSWKAELVTAAFRQPAKDARGHELLLPVLEDAASTILRLLGLADGSAERATVRRRLVPFFQEILPGREVVVEYGRDLSGRALGSSSGSDGGPVKDEKSSLTRRVKRRASRLVAGNGKLLSLGPGGRNGISSQVKSLPRIDGYADAGRGVRVPSSARVPDGCVGELAMETQFAEPEGWGLISDIDDTIKVTFTSSPTGILQSTFLNEPEPIAGMPELYAHMRQVMGASAPIVYLSASPYNLYPFLRRFRDSFYPFGQIILRDASWQSLPGLLSGLTLGTQDYKQDRMRRLHGWLPRRKMICFGDSTQRDPEAYATLAAEYPGWIRLICIRKVTGVDAPGLEAKNAPGRFERAFAALPRSLWHVFEDPSECYRLIDELVTHDP